MDVQIAALCDAAIDYQGKLCILGTFDTIFTKELPATHSQCSVAFRLIFRKIEEGHHTIKIHFVDEDGKLLMPGVDTSMDVAIPENSFFVSWNFVLNIQQMRFEKAGQYSIDIAIDGRQEASIPLQVRLLSELEPP
ncbi:MAG: hypothetical protein HY731_13615 [Candidatus Tectomicrobia bacterium]|nr:hypothetical protein [Candidatus Tectomicrobia bacterium]